MKTISPSTMCGIGILVATALWCYISVTNIQRANSVGVPLTASEQFLNAHNLVFAAVVVGSIVPWDRRGAAASLVLIGLVAVIALVVI